MCRQVKFGRLLIFVTMSMVLAGELTQASDWSEWLWGGRGSRTTVTDPYIPPPLVTDKSISGVDTTPGLGTTQSNLMLGTPGAMTLPPGGVIVSNGIASSGVSSGAYANSAQFTTASNIIPTPQVTQQQPVIEYEWTYSTIKDTTYEPVTVYDPRLGGYVTTMQEKQTESVLPWLHRKQVVRYKPATTDTITSNPSIGSTLPPAISDPSGKYIVNRLFPVSTVPSPPAQAVPVQTPVQTFPLYAGPMTTYAAESTSGSRVVASSNSPVPPPTTFQSTESVVMRIDSELPVVTVVPHDDSLPAASSPFDLAPQPYSTSIVSPSAHQVLYQTVPAIGISSSAMNTPDNRTSGNVPTGAASTPVAQTPASTQTGPSSNEPTLAPEQSAPTPVTRDTVQRPLIQDSLSDSVRPQPFEVPPGQQLPPPAQSSPIPSISKPSTGNDILLLKTPETEPSVSSTTQPAAPAHPRPNLSNSPTRMPPRRSPLSN